ncbi:MAG TPA: hypothetical protein VHR44_08530 [Beijerinckiaceae bacterium]|jgi:hypothetical protein|nr:hypothetical protein [Beijerinckiaceae bacterium]
MILAAREVNAALQQRDMDRLFYAIQNLLNAAANVSKALWGSGGKLAVGRQPLRDSIGIGDDSPLRNVTMRNNFEHFDERLDRWWKDSTHHNHIDFVVGPPNAVAGADDIDRFRFFDPTTTNLTFWGQEFNIQALLRSPTDTPEA